MPIIRQQKLIIFLLYYKYKKNEYTYIFILLLLFLILEGAIWTTLLQIMSLPIEVIVLLLTTIWEEVQTYDSNCIFGGKDALYAPDRGTPNFRPRIERVYGLEASQERFRLSTSLAGIIIMLGGTLHLETRTMNGTLIIVPPRQYETVDEQEMLTIYCKLTFCNSHHLMILRYERVTTVFKLSQVQIGDGIVSTNLKLAQQLHALAYPTAVQEHAN